jgi:hypothetical protein
MKRVIWASGVNRDLLLRPDKLILVFSFACGWDAFACVSEITRKKEKKKAWCQGKDKEKERDREGSDGLVLERGVVFFFFCYKNEWLSDHRREIRAYRANRQTLALQLYHL